MIYLKRLLSLIILASLGFMIWQHDSRQRAFETRFRKQTPLFEKMVAKNSSYRALPFEDKLKIRPIILKNIAALQAQGWSQTTIQTTYLNSLYLRSDISKSLKKQIEKPVKQARIIGSNSFRQLWQTEYGNAENLSQDKADKLLHLIMTSIKMPKALNGQVKQTKRLLSHFDNSLTPSDPFWSQLALLVQTLYPNDDFTLASPFSDQVHQLRYIISGQQAQWVRHFYREDGETDSDALAKYLAHLSKDDYSLTESSRYHNKVAAEKTSSGKLKAVYADNVEQSNFKVLIKFHSEFIVSEQGQFLNETDVENRSRNAIINSASFNYANQNDARHFQLDVNSIEPHEPKFALQALLHGDSVFMVPTIKQQKSKHNKIFSRKGKSSKQLVKAVVKQFSKLIDYYQSVIGNIKKES
ncbi:DUF3114 domain-containing protein [Streptococcus sp. HF-1907]|uniref:DUF3114 domain-containing protein n=1 Tax=Streptococcus sp. HF-1907 TaxID=2785793 RepID=UPI00189E6941|nr:DUF3114 domain-containing protein [Streptococcus sp. HF-1907]MBF7093960.1 DUF3114 domain-containing protein [Streptococcus sp. HF-1907]